jgi:hypothetical protein
MNNLNSGKVSKPNISDLLYSLAKGGVSLVPGAGGLLSELLSLLISSPATRRQDKWINEQLEEAFRLIAEKADSSVIENLDKNDLFLTIVLQATSIAIRNHQKDKLEALKNAIVNSVLRNPPAEDMQLLFLNLVNDLTPTHLFALKVIESPYKWCIDNSINVNDRDIVTELTVRIRYCNKSQKLIDLGYPGIFEKAFPRIREELDFYKKIFKDLFTEGLTRIEKLEEFALSEQVSNRSEPLQFTSLKKEKFTDLIKPVITPLGKQFINFINIH